MFKGWFAWKLDNKQLLDQVFKKDNNAGFQHLVSTIIPVHVEIKLRNNDTYNFSKKLTCRSDFYAVLFYSRHHTAKNLPGVSGQYPFLLFVLSRIYLEIIFKLVTGLISIFPANSRIYSLSSRFISFVISVPADVFWQCKIQHSGYFNVIN